MIGTALNLIFVIVEFIAGFLSNSIGLLSDAGHNLGDTASLVLAWIAFALARVQPSQKYTYGLSKSTVIVSLANACILLVAIGMILVESVRKLQNPEPLGEDIVIWVASVGIAINFGTALMFMKDRKEDLNIRGAFLHMAMDALVSVGVVVSAVIIKFTGWYIIDPILGIVVACIIFASTWSLLRQSIRLSLDGVPDNIDYDKVERAIMKVTGVTGIHHLHIWALGTSETALTVHVAVSDVNDSEIIKNKIRTALSSYGIGHATIETEPNDYNCKNKKCIKN